VDKLGLSNGILTKPIKVTLYGVEGIGKTTLVSQLAPTKKPIFFDTETGTIRVNCQRMLIGNKTQFDQGIEYLLTTKHPFDTLVIDTITGLEPMMEQVVLAKSKKKFERMGDFEYGRGSIYLREEFDRVLYLQLDEIIRHGLNVILIGHAQIQRMQLPELIEGFDRYELAMDKKVSASIRQWSDHVLFANWDYRFTENERGDTRGIAGKNRVLYTQHTAAFDAKNRGDLPEKLEWNAEKLLTLFPAIPILPANQEQWETLRKLLAGKVSDEDLFAFLQPRFPAMRSLEDFAVIDAKFLDFAIKENERFINAIATHKADLAAKAQPAAAA
jgi:hypothetical protein